MEQKLRNKKLRENEEVKRWIDNIKTKSEVTANEYLRSLGRWLERINENPESIREKAKNDFETLKNKIADEIRKMEEEGKAGSYIGITLKAVISYLKFYNIPVKFNINIKNEHRNLTTENERVPNKEELKSILRMANPRARAMIGLMAYSGVRPEAIGNYRGKDGLRISDIPDLIIKDKKIEWKQIPAQLKIREELSKNRRKYLTFITGEECKYIEEYLNIRINNKEEIKGETPVIKAEWKKSRKEITNKFLTSGLIGIEIRKTIRKAGFKWRPYVLRAYFSTALDIAEAKGDISHPWRQLIMGHKGDIEATYSTGKQLTEERIEDIRKAYSNSQKYFETYKEYRQEEDTERTLREYAIMIFETTFNIAIKDTTREELYRLTAEEFQEELKRLSKEKKAELLNNGNKQKAISMEDVESYLLQGWEYVATLPNGKAIIKIPE